MIYIIDTFAMDLGINALISVTKKLPAKTIVSSMYNKNAYKLENQTRKG